MSPPGKSHTKLNVDTEWVEKLDALVEPVQAMNPAFTVTRSTVLRLILRHGYDAVVRDLTTDGLMP